MRALTGLEQQTLDRVLANRVIVPRDEAERKRLERLYASGWVLHGKHRAGRYYYLSYRATRHFNVHRLYSRPPGYSCLVRALATTLACDKLDYVRLSASQFAERFPALCAKDFHQGQYCLSPKDRAIGYVHVDVAQPARRIAWRVKEIFDQRDRGQFGARINAGRFFVLVVTATERKRRQIERRLPPALSTETVVVPELLEIL